MAFEYGESYYGLRTWGESDGEVKDASASLTATSSIGAVNWEVAIGSGTVTITVTSATTCSGEQVILEESDRYTYGSGLWGRNVFAGDANLQTVVTATSSVTASCERIKLSGAVVAGASGFAAIGGFLGNASAIVSVTSATTCSGETVAERSGAITSASSITANSTCTFNFTIPIAVTSATTCSAEKFFLESSDKYAYGSGLYGTQVFDSADLQTIISATSVNTSCSAAKVNLAIATVTVASATTTASERIHQQGGNTTATATVSSAALVVFVGASTISATGVFTQTTTDWRVRESTGALSATSGTATIGREKWELIVNNTNTWTQIAA